MFRYEVPGAALKILFILSVVLIFSGCAGHINEGMGTHSNSDENGNNITAAHVSDTHLVNKFPSKNTLSSNRFKPSVVWRPSYKMSSLKVDAGARSTSFMKVGADIKSLDGKVSLESVVNYMAKLKNMSVNWSSDTNQKVKVSVNIKAKDNFWKTLQKLLEQVDYFYEFRDNTIIVKYKDTQRFYITAPHLVGGYKTSVGGDFLGGATGRSYSDDSSGGLSSSEPSDEGVHGTLRVEEKNGKFDIWKEIEQNLINILEAMTVGHVVAMERRHFLDDCVAEFPDEMNKQRECIKIKEAVPISQEAGSQKERKDKSKDVQKSNSGATSESQRESESKSRLLEYEKRGFYFTTDKSLGIITVTAPKIILEKIASYIDNLNNMLSKQVVIDAKLIEVQLTNDNRMGIDWSDVLKNSKLEFNTIAGAATGANPFIASLSPPAQTFPNYIPYKNTSIDWKFVNVQRTFSVIVNMLQDFGKVKVLSNPKISLLNGQPGLITGGQTQRIVSKVTSNITTSSGSSTVTYDINTQDILSGIGVSVVANIDNNDNIILHLTPVNTELLNSDNIEEKRFGSESTGFVMVQLPRIALREITTMAKVKSGQLVIIGGIISEQSGKEGNKIPLLGDIPYIGYAFKYERNFKIRKELVILLSPQLVTI